MESLKHLKTSLVFVLAFVGVKMLLAHKYPIPNTVSLAVIVGILAIGVIASLMSGKVQEDLEAAMEHDEEIEAAEEAAEESGEEGSGEDA